MNAIRHLFKVVLVSTSLVVFGTSFSSQAATANVLVGSGGFRFVPAVTNINAGDRVLWTWAGNTHNVTSITSAWTASPTQNTGTTFTNTFNSAGTYPYECTIHVTSGMTGAVVVATANLPPTVSITNPASGAVFAAPANVTIQASASDSDGTVTNVHFLIGSTNLGNVTVAPYSIVVNSLAAGSYTLSAVASDNGNATATNQVTISVVTPVLVLLSAPLPAPPTEFSFSYTANAGLSYIVQRSTDLASTDWTTLITNTAGSGSINFTDLNATVNPAFYRVGRLPNP
jgi:plastocyanin